MNHETDHDPMRDPTLESALRDLGPEPPLEAVVWDRLARAIIGHAAERFAAPASKVSWWQPMAHWARPAIPLGVAAAIALLLVLRSPWDPGPVATAGAGARIDAAEALLLDDPLARSIYSNDPASVLEAALAYEGSAP